MVLLQKFCCPGELGKSRCAGGWSWWLGRLWRALWRRGGNEWAIQCFWRSTFHFVGGNPGRGSPDVGVSFTGRGCWLKNSASRQGWILAWWSGFVISDKPNRARWWERNFGIHQLDAEGVPQDLVRSFAFQLQEQEGYMNTWTVMWMYCENMWKYVP